MKVQSLMSNTVTSFRGGSSSRLPPSLARPLVVRGDDELGGPVELGRAGGPAENFEGGKVLHLSFRGRAVSTRSDQTGLAARSHRDHGGPATVETIILVDRRSQTAVRMRRLKETAPRRKR